MAPTVTTNTTRLATARRGTVRSLASPVSVASRANRKETQVGRARPTRVVIHMNRASKEHATLVSTGHPVSKERASPVSRDSREDTAHVSRANTNRVSSPLASRAGHPSTASRWEHQKDHTIASHPCSVTRLDLANRQPGHATHRKGTSRLQGETRPLATRLRRLEDRARRHPKPHHPPRSPFRRHLQQSLPARPSRSWFGLRRPPRPATLATSELVSPRGARSNPRANLAALPISI